MFEIDAEFISDSAIRDPAIISVKAPGGC